MKKNTFLIALFLLLTFSVKAQLVTMYDLKHEGNSTVTPTLIEEKFIVPNQNISFHKKAIFERGKIPVETNTLTVNNEKILLDVKSQIQISRGKENPSERETLPIEYFKKIGNRTHFVCFYKGKGVYAFYDDPIIPNPHKEYLQKLRDRGFKLK